MLHRHDKHQFYLRIRALAREMRKNSTPAEDFFWEKVRDRRLFGLKINRQFIIACELAPDHIKYYIADFHCFEHRLIFELDGQIHLRQQEEDLLRTERMQEHGFTVVRFTNEEILYHWPEVEYKISLLTGVYHS